MHDAKQRDATSAEGAAQAEAGRQAAEIGRAHSEIEREVGEARRGAAEDVRIWAEDARSAADEARHARDEAGRILGEARTLFEKIEEKRQASAAALKRAIAATKARALAEDERVTALGEQGILQAIWDAMEINEPADTSMTPSQADVGLPGCG